MSRSAKPLADRLALGVRPTLNGCWEWTGALNATGYGRMRVGRRVEYAHRVAYELLVGPIPKGLVIDHLCRNPACCNPQHLEAVEQRDNLRRGRTFQAANIAKTHCAHGHEFTPENTRLIPRGRRCIACERRRARESARRRSANA